MSVQRIDRAESRTHGWQARAYTVAPRYLSAFFADREHGGQAKALELARAAEKTLRRIASRRR